MKFIDEARISVKAGNGGNGCISFHREKYVPKGGPDGGNGGKGGNVIIRADKQLATLMDFRYRRKYKADSGEHGKGSTRDGKWGKDLVIRVPSGTLVKDAITGDVLADLVDDESEVIVARGGKGGRGNAEFATPTNRAPRFAEPGISGEECEIALELKLLADVGLVGFPNAGKSTLISVISAARPKIADYPFTTLVPNLGIVQFKEGASFVVADIPGLLEGAHRGKGLGVRFLRHIVRTRVLVFLIDSTSQDPKKDFQVLVNELKEFDESLQSKPKLVCLTKADLVDERTRNALKRMRFGKGTGVRVISAVQSLGIVELIEAIWKELQRKTGKSQKGSKGSA